MLGVSAKVVQFGLGKKQVGVNSIKGGAEIDQPEPDHLPLLDGVHPAVVHLEDGGGDAVVGSEAVVVGVEEAVTVHVFHHLHEHDPLQNLRGDWKERHGTK